MNRWISIASLLAALTAPSLGWAQSENVSDGPLTLHVSLSSSGLSEEQVRLAIAEELGREVRLATNSDASLSVWDDAGKRLNLRYTTRDGRALTRTLDLPRDRQKTLQTVAVLSGNLARDQTSELVGALNDQRAAASAEANPPEPGPSNDAPEPAQPPAPAAPPTPTASSPRKDAGNREPAQDSPPWTPDGYRPVNASVWHPISIDPKSHEHGYVFELGFGYSHVGGLAALGVSLGALRVDGPSTGLAVGTLWLDGRGPLRGLGVSALFAQSRGESQGMLVGGLATHHSEGTFSGAQYAGALSLADKLIGMQAAGVFASSKELLGTQWAGIAALTRGPAYGLIGAGALSATRDVKGAVMAGALSLSQDVDGVMLAGATNVARDVNGIAIAGGVNVQREVNGLAVSVVNVQRRVRGLQIGVINIADEVDGGAIGVVNLARNGRVSAVSWASQDAVMAGVRFIVGRSYSELAFGQDVKQNRYVAEAGLGYHTPLSERLTLAIGAHTQSRALWKDHNHTNHQDAIGRGTLGWRLTPKVELFVSGGARVGIEGDARGDVRPEGRLGIAVF